jgi:hypothetical protein
MKSLFNESDNLEMIARINRLSPGSKGLWGKMSVSQMMKHAQMPVRVAFEDLQLKRGLIGILFGRMMLKKMLSEDVWKQNLPTDKNFIIHSIPDFETEKNNLVSLVTQFGNRKESITTKAHPFFGKMSVSEWDQLVWKHLDHHLRQFGV